MSNSLLSDNLISTANHTSVASHVISPSPVKDDGNCWLRKLDLTFRDKLIIQSTEWLNDNIMYASQCLLRDQNYATYSQQENYCNSKCKDTKKKDTTRKLCIFFSNILIYRFLVAKKQMSMQGRSVTHSGRSFAR